MLGFLKTFAQDHHLSYKQDKTGNLVILRPGSGGGEHAPAIVIQVCQWGTGNKKIRSDLYWPNRKLKSYRAASQYFSLDGNHLQGLTQNEPGDSNRFPVCITEVHPVKDMPATPTEVGLCTFVFTLAFDL